MHAQCNYGLCQWGRTFEPGDIEGPGTALLKHWEKAHSHKLPAKVVAVELSDSAAELQSHEKAVA